GSLALFDFAGELGVRATEVRGAFLHAFLELLVRASKRLLRFAPVGDVERDAEQVSRRATLVEDRNLLGVEPPPPFGGVDWLFGDVEELARSEDRAILRLKKLRLLGG